MPRLPVIAILALLLTSSLCHAREIARTLDDAPTPDTRFAGMTKGEYFRASLNLI